MREAVDLSVIVVSWNTRAILRECLGALFTALDELGRSAEVIVVDNGSSDGSPAEVRRAFPRARLFANAENRGYGRAANQGLGAASGRYRCLLNSDAIATAPAFAALIAFLDETPHAAAVTPQLLDPGGAKQHSFDAFPDLLTELVSKTLARALSPRRYPSKRLSLDGPLLVDVALGACIVLRASALDETGLFDEEYFFFQEDADLCMRLRKAGYGVYVLPSATVVHLQGKSKANAPQAAHIEYQRSMYLFFGKHRGLPAYAALRALRPVKLLLDLASTALLVLGTLGTLGALRRPRRNLGKYWALVAWHLRLCPADAGLAGLAPPSLPDEEVAKDEVVEAASEEHR